MTIMLFTLPYVNFAQYLTLNGEITKNIYTVYKIQRKQLRDRRNKVENKEIKHRKNYFEKELETLKDKPKQAKEKIKPKMIIPGQKDTPKKKKKKPEPKNPASLSISEQINAENRKNEEEG